jgi:integrase
LTGEAGNASRRKVIVEATARSLEWASAWRTQDESGPTFSRVIRTNFGGRMAKIFRENSDSLVNWDEQKRLFSELPLHLWRMALFAVNSGCRDKEICRLQWNWEIKIPELNTSVFIIPGEKVKNRQDRLVVLNTIANQVIQEVRGLHPAYVFTYQGRAITRMLNSAWMKARIRAGLPQVRVHDLKHTFGRRLRAAGVNFEDRQDLLGHKSGRITTHYSQVELINLVQGVNKVCEEGNRKPVLTILRRAA